jgi:hypothetical protein
MSERHIAYHNRKQWKIMADFKFTRNLDKIIEVYGIYCATHCLRFNLI